MSRHEEEAVLGQGHCFAQFKLTATAATFACARGLTGREYFSLGKPACLQGYDTVYKQQHCTVQHMYQRWHQPICSG